MLCGRIAAACTGSWRMWVIPRPREGKRSWQGRQANILDDDVEGGVERGWSGRVI